MDDHYLLAGDIGGTKTNLALFSLREESYLCSHFASYPSQSYPDLLTIVQEFLKSSSASYAVNSLQTACFAIAGPVIDQVCKTTNLPWIVDAASLSQALKLEKVYLLNDLEANAWAIEVLHQSNSLFELYAGSGNKRGNRAVVSPGTGLGEAGLYWDGHRHYPFACEGGHCEFAPRDALQLELCHYLQQKFGHVSYERVLSGPGFLNLYLFLKEQCGFKEEGWLTEEFRLSSTAQAITQNALNKKSEICIKTLDLFVSILGSEASNCALKFMSKGGLYLGGGIPPKILPKLKEPTFFEGFVDKGRFREFLEAIPVYVILDDRASLKGAAHYCRTLL